MGGISTVSGHWRLDLVAPDEHDAILDRVDRLTTGRRRLSLGPVAPREDGPVPDLLRVDPASSPRRRAALREAVEATARALDHLPLPPDPTDLARDRAEAWREAVRVALDATLAEARAGRLLFRDQAARALAERLQAPADALGQPLHGLPGPVWRPPTPDALPLGGQVQDLVHGTAGVIRDLRTRAGALAEDGEEAWHGWVRGSSTASLRAHREALLDARAAVAPARDRVRTLLPAP